MRVSWSKFKTFINNKSLDYDEVILEDDNILLEVYDGPIYRRTILTKDSADYTDYINNYQSKAGKNKRTRKWHSQLHGIEFVTSRLNRLYNKDIDNNNLNFTTIKYYNNLNTELVAGTQTELDNNCVRTVVDWEPTYDITLSEIYVYQPSTANTDTRIWIEGVPDKTVANNGSIPFIEGGINLKQINSPIVFNPGIQKQLRYNAVEHTNKIRITTRHPAGTKSPVMIVFKIDKENK